MASAEKERLRSEKTDSKAPTRCYRCGSIMVIQRFYGLEEVFWGQRCVCCGDIVDPIILENRNAVIGRCLQR